MSLLRTALDTTVGLALAVALAACSPAGFLNATAPDGDVEVDHAIPYAEGPTRWLDVYAPASACRAPVVVFFYGGSWETGSREMYRFLGLALARRGVIAVIPDYRLYPEVRFPTFMDDAAAAVAWSRANAQRFGGDAGQLFLMGHSAGAQIATLLALDPVYLRKVGVEPESLAGVIGISGPYDFLPLTDPTLKIIFGPEDTWPQSQPINFVTPSAPPMLLVTGAADHTVYPRNTEHLAARLRTEGVPVEERFYDGLGHTSTIGAFAWPLEFLAPVRRDVLDFIGARDAARAGTAGQAVCAPVTATAR
jgi:acetyl esterase/lipase